MAQKRPAKSSIELPREPIHRLTEPLMRFLHVAAASGVVLLIATAAALILTNSPLSESYLEFWKTPIVIEVGSFRFDHPLYHLINDGLMVIFFFVVGLEVKREMVVGELRDLRRAALPIAGAIGGMLVPAIIYLVIQFDEPAMRGWGIPMATDIAFVVGCMAILGSRIPHGLRVTLLSLAIADDIGAILVIAIGYSDNLSFTWLLYGFAGIGLVSAMARLGVRSFGAYTVAGIFVWFAFHESGVHATIAGVILGLMTPARSYLGTGFFARALHRVDEALHGNWEKVDHQAEKVRKLRQVARETVSPLEYLETALHPWVSFVIMPIFALANAGVPFQVSALGDSVAIAVMLGLFIGKPLGIVAFAWIAVKLKVARLPSGVSWGLIVAGGFLAGIGFTMALFVSSLALQGASLNSAKIGVLSGSVISAITGMCLMVFFTSKKRSPPSDKD